PPRAPRRPAPQPKRLPPNCQRAPRAHADAVDHREVFFHPSRWCANYGPTQRTESLGQVLEGTRIRSCTRKDADSPKDRISSWDLWNLKGVFRAGFLQILSPDTVRSPTL